MRTSDDAVDFSLLEESLAKTVWEQMLANDDALRLAGLLQEAMNRDHDRITVRQLREIKKRQRSG